MAWRAGDPLGSAMAGHVAPAGRPGDAVRIVADQTWRIQNVAKEFDITPDEAKRRVMRTESDRRAFIRKYFNADITDPTNYDLVVNTATLDLDDTVKVISSALGLVECVFVEIV